MQIIFPYNAKQEYCICQQFANDTSVCMITPVTFSVQILRDGQWRSLQHVLCSEGDPTAFLAEASGSETADD